MLRALIRPAFRGVSILTQNQTKFAQSSEIVRKFSQLTMQPSKVHLPVQTSINKSILSHPLIPQIIQQKRTFIKHSMTKGKRKTVKAVIARFKRLDWGIWIRTRAGRFKRMWKKSRSQRYRSRQHVFCNATQSRLLDKMVCDFWKKPKYYIDDPYAPYQTRESFRYTRRKPIEWD